MDWPLGLLQLKYSLQTNELQMEDLGSRIKQVSRELKHYVETRLELTLLNFGDKVSYLIGQSIQQLIGWTVLAIGLLFGMTALAIYLGELLDEPWAGYVIVAAPFVIIGLILVVMKPKSIASKIQEQILAEFLDTLSNSQEDVKQITAQETKQKES